MKFQTDTTEERLLFNFSYRDLLDESSDAWLYIDLFDQFDYSDFREVYKEDGQIPKDPKLMLRTIFYGLTHGVVSGWKLESVCRNDNRFIVLSGNSRPDKRTFHRFINRHEENINIFFVKVVQVAQEMGLANLGRVAIDGTRFKANASTHKSMKYEKMQRAIEHIKEELKVLRNDLEKENSNENNLEDEIDKSIQQKKQRIEKIKKAKEKIEAEYNKKSNKSKKIEDCRKALNDTDSQSLAHKSCSKGHMFGYNAQAAVEASNQIIVAAELHDKATDYEALPELIDKIEEYYNETPDEALADLGYKSVDNIKKLEEKNIEAIIATGSKEREEIEKQFSEQIIATKEKHVYKCINGKHLPIFARRSDGRTEFKITQELCNNCQQQHECKAFGKKTISVMKEEDRLRLNELLTRSRTQEFKDKYKRRKTIIEPVFGNIKNKGMKILVTGKKKVSVWWKMACTAHNIEKIINNMALKGVEA